MQTEDIINQLKLTAQLMELHGENSFKTKAISNAVFKLDKLNIALERISAEELESIDGIGKGITQKILELQSTGTTSELNSLLGKTPEGVIDMLSIKGIGPKKVAQLWKELQIESTGELLYACHENRLIDLKGFGSKTQDQVKKAIEFNMASRGKYHYASVENYAHQLLKKIKSTDGVITASLTGAMRRKCEIVEKIEIIVAANNPIDFSFGEFDIPTEITTVPENHYYSTLFNTSASPDHLQQLNGVRQIDYLNAKSEEEIYMQYGLPFILPELREGIVNEIDLAKTNKIPELIELRDLKGILHNHSNYSDGLNSLQEMAEHCRGLGYEYLGMCDHSKSAFYANGLKEEKVFEQHAEIDALNKVMAPFKIFKGIESDILNDGSLDYSDDILKSFDFIVASVHSNLKMDEARANARLVKAIENPYTTILGHMTGRLLLSRRGYPVNAKKIIDACAANNVVIELNAHPYRLDIDWRLIPYCLEKDVMISINPDAHQKEGFRDMYYGICVARKGLLSKEHCFNARSLSEIESYFNKRKSQ